MKGYLVVILRAMGLIDMFAILAVFGPRTWIANVHQVLGMGEFPHSPITGYLARSASIWYASFGLLLWFVSYDIERYTPLIKCLAWMMIIQGVVVTGIDIVEGMPGWWTVMEGPCCFALGTLLLCLLMRTSQSSGHNSV